MWQYLLVLSLLPILSVLSAGGLLVGERVRESQVARSIERAMTSVADLDSLRSALQAETMATAVQGASVAYHLTLDQLNHVLGSSTMRSTRGPTVRHSPGPVQ